MKRFHIPAILLLLTAAAPDDDAFDVAVSALTSGSRAERHGDTRRLRIAAGALRGSGAVALDGGDVLERWSRTAKIAALPAERERALGPGYRSLALRSGGIVRFEQTFLAGQRARVAVVAIGAAPFAMQVTDDDRAMICEASPSRGRCDWVPEYTTRFKIELRNSGTITGRYFIVMK